MGSLPEGPLQLLRGQRSILHIYPMGHVGLYASSQLELAVGMLQLHLAGDTLRCDAFIGLRAR